MEAKLEIVVHGRGNAWPVPLGEEHPFYDRKDPRDLANASFSVQVRKADELQASVLIDAGHGTVQSLLSNDNRIPDCICLTHGHLDHTLSVDWVVQSFWRRHRKEKRYPVYASLPVYRFLIRSYPHLEDLTEHRELEFGEDLDLGESIAPGADLPLKLRAYPAYHGQSAVGASMLLFQYNGYKILFTGDLLAPVLRREDYKDLQGVHMLVVDTNNRFPWPCTNHWSFAGSPADPARRSEILETFAAELSWNQVSAPQLQEDISGLNRAYLMQLKQQWDPERLPLTILELMQRIGPRRLMLVHYSGAEDHKYSGQEILSTPQLQDWASSLAARAGIPGEILVPVSGQRIQLN